MSFGLLGTLARESEYTDLGAELTQVEDIAGEAAYDDASEIAREAEMDASKMIQGLAVADRLEDQVEYGTAYWVETLANQNMWYLVSLWKTPQCKLWL